MLKLIIISMVMILLFSGIARADYCLDNSTIAKNMTFNSNAYNFTEPCDYGCDNTTNTCNPPEYQQSLIILGIVVFVLIMLYAIYRRG